MPKTKKHLQDIIEPLKKSKIGNSILAADFHKDELCLTIRREDIKNVCMFLRSTKEYLFHMLVDICGADYPERPERFEVVYNLLSMHYNMRLRLKVCVADGDIVPSIVSVFPTAGWFEREAWDLYGVPFSDNPDLRRLLTDYGFQGHPLRKDFPLTGYVELRYDEDKKRVVYEPVKLTQDFRRFDFISPWEGMTNVQLPGDEKAVKPNFGPDWRVEMKKEGGAK